MKIGLAQINTRIGDLASNVDSILGAARAAEKADVVVFPEMVLTGYPPRDLLSDHGFITATQEALQQLAKDAKGGPTLIVGAPVPSGATTPGHPGLYNAAVLIGQGRIQGMQPKRLLPAYDVFHEPRWFVPGPSSSVFEIAGSRFGLAICEDVWDEGYPIHPPQELITQGAEWIAWVSASPYRDGVFDQRLYQAKNVSKPLVFVNAVGAHDELIFDGRSFVLSADGELTCVLPACKEAVEVVDLEIATQPSATIAEDDVPRGLPVLFHSLVLGVRDFCHKNGVPDAWLGLSGGIDSAVVACIAAEALGPGRLHTLALPSKFSDPASTESARELAGTLGASFEVKSIERLHEAIELDLKDILATDREGGTTAENLQARLRMTLLMGYANRYGGVLLNTSNKTELTLGYGTLYADLAGTVSVIGDLTKPRVYQLARWISKNVTPIPDFIIERPPSAELKDDQVDPFDYETLSPKLEDLIVGSSTTTMTEQERVSLTRRVRLAEYKRWQSGVILKVSEKAFGSGRMMPITRR